ncbi:DUF6497 family protein [Primorskyibacter sp. S187A]|uniref:DUF6497 family protein n=1 Tax=Primorskyibacter sp. S187A TaxID=3415130 RepID=UPI003C7B2790
MISAPGHTAAHGLSCACCAAPAGGALQRGWGCGLFLTLASIAAPIWATPLTVPSGHDVTVLEYLEDADTEGSVLRARYVAPHVNAPQDIDAILEDMTFLCETDALPKRDGLSEIPDRIVVSLSAAPLSFGEINAEVAQYFEVYRIENGRCIWELY